MKSKRKGKSTLKRLFKGKTVAFIILLFVVLVRVDYPSAQCEHLERRIKLLEERIKVLELKLKLFHDSLGSDQPASYSNEKSKYTPYKERPLQETKQISAKSVVTKKELLSNFIKSRVLEKNIESTGKGKKVSLLIAYTNISRKDIVSFKGNLSLEDQSGDLLANYFIDIFLEIPSLESKSSFSEVPYGSGYKRLYSMKVEDIKTSLNLTEIVFSDGTVGTPY